MEHASGYNGSALERDVSMEPRPHRIEEHYHMDASYGADQTEDTIDDTGREASGGRSPFPRFAQEFSSHTVADILGTDATSFDRMKTFQDSKEKGLYTPFADHDEWELARWLIKTVNKRATEEFLKLPIVSH